jgi:hypothetical protein
LPFEQQEYIHDPKSKRDVQFNKEKFFNQPLTKDVYKFPVKSSEEYGWREPIDVFSNYGYGLSNLDGGVIFNKPNPNARGKKK